MMNSISGIELKRQMEDLSRVQPHVMDKLIMFTEHLIRQKAKDLQLSLESNMKQSIRMIHDYVKYAIIY